MVSTEGELGEMAHVHLTWLCNSPLSIPLGFEM
jgi:hypothetical protein